MRIRLFPALAAAALLAAPGAPRAEQGDHDEEQGQQEPGEGPGREKKSHGERMLQMLDRRLELRPEQRKKVQAIIEDSKSEHERLQAEMKALREKQQKLMNGQHEKIRALLDDEQKWKFDEFSVETRRRMKGGGFPGKGRREGPWKRPGPPEDEEGGGRYRKGMPDDDPRQMPPPEIIHETAPPKKGE